MLGRFAVFLGVLIGGVLGCVQWSMIKRLDRLEASFREVNFSSYARDTKTAEVEERIANYDTRLSDLKSNLAVAEGNLKEISSELPGRVRDLDDRLNSLRSEQLALKSKYSQDAVSKSATDEVYRLQRMVEEEVRDQLRSLRGAP